jgi:tRNA pseudouridine32 synthase/23S rRNA pseudouridine746 synthase
MPEPFPSPFDDIAPHPLARDAGLALQAELRAGRLTPELSTEVLHRPEGGKMFGVLVVEQADGRREVLRAFSGQVDGHWNLPGWAPPLFDAGARGAIEPEADRVVKDLTRRLEAIAAGAEYRGERQDLAQLDAELARARAALRATSAERQRDRLGRREALLPGDRAGRRLLDQESRLEDLERRRRERALRDEYGAARRVRRRLTRRVAALDRLRQWVSRRAMRAIHDSYRLTNFRGATTTLRDLFAPGEPPWGSGDCAGPKLVAHALRLGARPVAMAEFWWGAPPPGGGRVEGAFYPACVPKCGPILAFLLDGLDVAPRRTWQPSADAATELRILHEDDRIVAVAKPAGLLSVPARDVSITDSLEARLMARYPTAQRVKLVHRLDLDTSGVVLAALDEDAYRHLQAQFAERSVQKRYVAWLDGEPAAERGSVSLPMRVDLDQRPRQIVDFIHGREAVTDWKRLGVVEGRTRVAFFPRTGRTHQLRVHAAHPDGLGCPIVGDRLYGQPGDRLLLHAESLTFRHPDGRRLTISDPAPF